MTTKAKDKPTGLALLREPFPANQISKLPKPTKKQTDEVRADFKKGRRCTICGGWHHPDVVHLDYVGHAALTDRLLDADINWDWEPLALTEQGLPLLDQIGGLWIKLTVCGKTRLGYGDADGKTGGNAVKEAIGDALRNASMRFGAALDLWHKGDLHAEQPEDEAVAPANDAKPKPLKGPHTSKTALWSAIRAFDHELHGCGDIDMLEGLLAMPENKELIEQVKRDATSLWDGIGGNLPPEFEPLESTIAKMRKEFENIDQFNSERAA